MIAILGFSMSKSDPNCNPWLYERLPDQPADSRCEDCRGQGFYYAGDWARTCPCRYLPDLIRISP
jgi:hypothetical protein